MAETSAGWSALASMEKTMSTYQTSDNRCLTDAELDGVSGGEGNVANACIHAVTQWLDKNTLRPSGFGRDLARELSCH